MLELQIFKIQGIAEGWLFKNAYFPCMATEIFCGV